MTRSTTSTLFHSHDKGGGRFVLAINRVDVVDLVADIVDGDLVVDLVDIDLDVEVSTFRISDFSNFRKFQSRVLML